MPKNKQKNKSAEEIEQSLNDIKGRLGWEMMEKRQQCGITQAKLAEKADVEISTIRRYEHGEIGKTFLNVAKIAKTLNISIDALIYEDQRPENEVAKIFERLDRIDEIYNLLLNQH